MKIKLLSAFAALSFILIAVTSCLDSDNTSIEYSSDDTIKFLRLDTIYGVKYNFSIDQRNQFIYNKDSLPYSADTIINKILIDSLVYSGWITLGDSLYTYTSDSLDLSNTMVKAGGKPLQITVHSPDGQHTRTYSLEVRRHLVVPDSMVWSNPSTSFSDGVADGLQKTIILNNQLLTYTSEEEVWISSLPNGQSWSKQTISGLSGENVKMTSFIPYKDKIYCVTENGNLFESTDGISWQQTETAIGSGVVTLIGAHPNHLSAVVTDSEGKNRFANSNAIFSNWELGEETPATFPTEHITMTSYPSNTNENIYKYILMGKPANSTVGKTTPWYSLDGKRWVELSTNYYYLPEMEMPTVIYYNEKLYAFGGDFSAFYVSEEGLTWKPVEKRVLFPERFKGRKAYSTVIDNDHFLWIIWSRGIAEYTETDDDDEEITITEPYSDEVWKGRINELGFAK